MSTAIRDWLMRLIAGRRYAYWLHPEASRAIGGLADGRGATLGMGAAMALADALRQAGCGRATYTLREPEGETVVTAIYTPRSARSDGAASGSHRTPAESGKGGA